MQDRKKIWPVFFAIFAILLAVISSISHATAEEGEGEVANSGKKSVGIYTMVIPLLFTEKGLQQFDENNAWFSAWSNIGHDENSVVIVPFGDIEDYKIINLGSLLDGNFSAVNNLAKKYAVENVIIAQATYNKQNGAVVAEMLYMAKEKKAGTREFYIGNYDRLKTETLENSIRYIKEDLFGYFSDRNPASLYSSAHFVIEDPYNINRWPQLKARLEEIVAGEKLPINGIEVTAISLSKITFNLYYKNKFSAFASKLISNGFEIADRNGFYILRDTSL